MVSHPARWIRLGPTARTVLFYNRIFVGVHFIGCPKHHGPGSCETNQDGVAVAGLNVHNGPCASGNETTGADYGAEKNSQAIVLEEGGRSARLVPRKPKAS